MADTFDVAGRLAEARPSVDNTQCYVWACHLLGYQNPDLTTHSAQIRDWFSSEDGMDLHVLDADCAAVHAAAAAADDALGQQRDQLAHLTAAWHGAGAMSAQEFVRRHCDAAEKVTTSVRAAADALAELRDTLWQAVDTKAAAVTGIDDRRQGERPAWLAAAHTVTTGAGDRAAASELVDQQVKPYVDNDIRVDWLSAVRTATASIGNSYDTVTGRLESAPVHFDVPADFGPEPSPAADDAGLPPRDPAPTVSAASAPPPPPAPIPSYPAPPAMAVNPPAAGAVSPPIGGPPAAAPADAPMMPAAPLDQLRGLPQRFADTLSGPMSPGDPPDPPALADDVSLDDVPAPEDEAKDDETDCDPGDHVRMRNATPDTVADDPGPPVAPPPPPASPDAAPPGAPLPPPPPAPAPMPPASPPEAQADVAATPCEIAASELPQAGQ